MPFCIIVLIIGFRKIAEWCSRLKRNGRPGRWKRWAGAGLATTGTRPPTGESSSNEDAEDLDLDVDADVGVEEGGGVEATALDAASPNGGRVDEVAISVNDLEVLEKAELRGVTAAMF